MTSIFRTLFSTAVLTALALALILPGAAAAHDPDYTTDLGRDRCTFATTGSNPYFPLWPGYALVLEGEEEDDESELVEISSTITVLPETEMVDGVLTRVFEERELEDDELVEVSRNFAAICRETGDVWYFGEDVDIYEDGEIVSHDGAWRAGQNGAEPGILMPGNPLIGARYFEEVAPGVALDRGEIVGMGEEVTVPAGTFTDTLETLGTTPLAPEEIDEKVYARGVGVIVDQVIELVEIVPPPCQPDATTHCLQNGRFQVRAEWADFEGDEGDGTAILPSGESGEFWFFTPGNTELLVKVLDACDDPAFNSFWVFAAGLTNVEVTLTVTDTATGEVREYENDLGAPFEPVLDTNAFFTCDAGG
jgi:hypothetical protein